MTLKLKGRKKLYPVLSGEIGKQEYLFDPFLEHKDEKKLTIFVIASLLNMFALAKNQPLPPMLSHYICAGYPDSRVLKHAHYGDVAPPALRATDCKRTGLRCIVANTISELAN